MTDDETMTQRYEFMANLLDDDVRERAHRVTTTYGI